MGRRRGRERRRLDGGEETRGTFPFPSLLQNLEGIKSIIQIYVGNCKLFFIILPFSLPSPWHNFEHNECYKHIRA